MEKEFVIEWFIKNSIATKEELVKNQTMNYLDKGYVDSFGFLELITECEEKFQITFCDEDFSDDAIFTISGLIERIKNAANR